jgi:hypothetical protein
MHGQTPAAQLRIVDDVVVDERRGVDELDDRGVARSPWYPPSLAAISSTAGRRRLPPLVWM